MGIAADVFRVWVDADACPRTVLGIIRRMCKKRGFPVTTVSTWRHELDGEHHMTVDAAPQATDLAILARMRPGDAVITQDYGLAALVLAQGGRALSTGGQRFTGDNIDGMLAARAHAAKLRASSRKRGDDRLSRRFPRGPAPRSRADDERFAREFEKLLDECPLFEPPRTEHALRTLSHVPR